MTSKRAHELLTYDCESGKVFWRVSPCNATKAGDEAGRIVGAYRVAKVDYKSYPVHHLVWLLVYGVFPRYNIDHIDGNGLNNKVENLRDVPRCINQRNRKQAKNNTSGITGVHWDKVYKRWVAKVKINGESRFLGGYTSKEDAGIAREKYLEEHKELGFTTRHGK